MNTMVMITWTYYDYYVDIIMNNSLFMILNFLK